ncbi:hypothetical protein ASD89_24065 [Caulobacter sp. Root656]|nr:hypothetical protein ASD89_24065 [Caulobacter sp. Root656]
MDLGRSIDDHQALGRQQQFQEAQRQRLIDRQAQQDAAIAAAKAAPTAQNYAAIMALDPDHYEATKSAFDLLKDDERNTHLREGGSIYSALLAGRSDLAKKRLGDYITAGRKGGQDTSDDEHILSLMDADPDKARTAVGLNLAAIMGPDKFASAFHEIGEGDRANKLLPGQITAQADAHAKSLADVGLTTAQTNNLTNPAPKTAVAGTDMNGQPIYYNPNAAPPPAGSVAVNPSFSSFVDSLQASENSTGNPAAQNPRSSATGNGQFIKSTWLETVKSARPDIAAGKSDDQILALRSNPALSREMTTAYASQNAQALDGAGLPVTGASLAMAHKLGFGGAQTVLQADATMPLNRLLSREVIAANPQLKNLTAGAYAQQMATQFGTSSISTGPADPNATGDDFLAQLPPSRAKLIRAIANGDAPMPSGRGGTSSAGQALMQQVLQYDPTASAITLDARRKTREQFTSGTEARAINSANTVIGHLAGLDHAVDQLHNTNLGWFNAPAQGLGKAVGNKGTQKAVADFNFYKVAVANELTKVFRGSNGAEADVQGWLKQLDSTKSPVELHATVRSMIDGMNSRLDALGEQYTQGMGRKTDGIGLLSPHARDQLRKLQAGTTAAAGPPAKAIDYLKQNPQFAAAFDEKYGPGSAKRALER